MHANRNGKRYLTESKTAVQAQKKTLAGGERRAGGRQSRDLRRWPVLCKSSRRFATPAGDRAVPAKGGESITSREWREIFETDLFAFETCLCLLC